MAEGGTEWWASEPEKALYKQAVGACLDGRDLSDLLGDETTVTREDVTEAMCSSPYVDNVLGSGAPRLRHSRYRLSRRLSDLYLWALPASPSLRAIRDHSTFYLWNSGVVLGWGLTPVVLFQVGAPLGLLFPLIFVIAPALAFARPSAPAAPVWSRSAYSFLLGPITSLLWCVESLCGALWIRELERNGLRSQVELSARRLIDEGGNPLLVTGSHEGLGSHLLDASIVGRAIEDELAVRLAGLADGAIALSGPRGVGKSTLMRRSVRPGDFAVFVSAPAVYNPHEFLTSLFVRVCREYIGQAGHRVPSLVRLSFVHRIRRRVLGFLRRVPPLPYALPAVTFIGIGMFAATKQAVAAEDGVWGEHQLISIRPGQRLRAGGPARRPAGGSHGLRPRGRVALDTAPLPFLPPTGRGRVQDGAPARRGRTSVGTVRIPLLRPRYPSSLRRAAGRAGAPAIASLVLLILVWNMYVVWATSPATRRRFRNGGATAGWERWVHVAGTLLPFGLLAIVLVDAPLQPLLTDDETPFRIGAFLLGLLIGRLVDASPRLRIASGLVTACRDHLYRLQTVQSSGTALSTGATRFLTLGTSHTDALTSVPPNPPMLVEEFKDLLTRIATDEHRKGRQVVIAIDEIDRLGTDSQALAFLADIKAILGVAHVHYLLSVSEDVGSAFLRRGLPHRDVTDSSLDDVLHVPPCELAESAEILKRRVRVIDRPYITLAHGLSGGIPRDLIRYTRRLVVIRKKYESLSDVTQTLVVEELSQTLIGFRTLLAKQQETPGTVSALSSFRDLVASLGAVRERPEAADQLRGALARFVGYEAPGLSEEPRRLVEEASAYAYFCLTLLDIFGRPDYDDRLTATGHHDGHLELLATARQELAVSPHSARDVLDSLRRTWRLDRLSGRDPVA